MSFFSIKQWSCIFYLHNSLMLSISLTPSIRKVMKAEVKYFILFSYLACSFTNLTMQNLLIFITTFNCLIRPDTSIHLSTHILHKMLTVL
mmetsp:Transcript_1450/g.153  ORF Transcript_1450/g.153 Transcript_1450/m.153 type:complete len:90 (-) Transcript_1450:55-324(-)